MASSLDAITIEPSTFDLVVAGTSLPASLLAAASSSAGKSVLHIDPNPFYGSHYSSVSPTEITSLYPSADINGTVPEPSGRFLLDVSGPRLLYCADPMVDVMLRSGASRHVDFKSLDASLFYWEGELCEVPDSRQTIFKDKKLSLTEKSLMMKFMKLVKEYVESGGNGVTVEELEMPFVKFLERQRLPKKIQSIVLNAIAMSVYDQESSEECARPMSTKEGLESLALYSSSLGRFPNATGAFIYPVYGQGELPQAFCRCAAVKGAIYVLRMALVDLLTNKDDKHSEGVRLASGQEIFCEQLVVDDSITFQSSISSDVSEDHTDDKYQVGTGHQKLNDKVARMVCITRQSIKSDSSNILVFFPPKSLRAEQVSTVRALQLGSSLAFCPPGLFILYLSTLCENAVQGKENLRVAADALCGIAGNLSLSSKDVQESELIMLWSAAYVHELTQVQDSCGMFFTCPMPDGNLDYRSTLQETTELFHKLYPGEEFFPEKVEQEEELEDDSTD